jgi:hypothetical protein
LALAGNQLLLVRYFKKIDKDKCWKKGKKGRELTCKIAEERRGRNVGKVVVTWRTGAKVWYTVKKVIGFPVPSRDVTNQTRPVGESFNNR